jgi:hypothetical protein
MESTADLIFNAENVRMLVILAFGFCGYLVIKGQIRDMISENLKAFHEQLKANDFAHLNSTIEALTFTLEKNGFLKREDKEYIDSRLDK